MEEASEDHYERKELIDLRPIQFFNKKRSSVRNEPNVSYLGTGMQSTLARDLKLQVKPIENMHTQGIKDMYFQTLARAGAVDRQSLEQRRRILKTVNNDQGMRVRNKELQALKFGTSSSYHQDRIKANKYLTNFDNKPCTADPHNLTARLTD